MVDCIMSYAITRIVNLLTDDGMHLPTLATLPVPTLQRRSDVFFPFHCTAASVTYDVQVPAASTARVCDHRHQPVSVNYQ